jgi:hypothetical protein
MARRTRAGTFARVRGWLGRWSYTSSPDAATKRDPATTTVHFADFGMERPSVALVLSVQDDIRLTVKIRAEQA